MKQAAEIYEQMLQVFRDRTGLSVGDSADLSVRLYAAAAELETLYGYCRWSLAQSFPQTAVGEYLERHAALRGLSRKKAAAARGQVTFYVGEALAQDVPIPAETEITDAGGVSFFTEEAGVIPAGSLSAAVPAVCGVAGEGGNAAAGTVCRLPLPPAFVLWCGNETAFSGGCEEESDEELRQRVLSSFSKLPNGANAAYYESRARAQEGVAGVRVLPRNRGVGTVDVVISSQEGVPPQTLLETVRAELQQAREIGVDVAVLAPETVPVDLKITVWPGEEEDPETAMAEVEQAVRGLFDGRLLGNSLYLARVGSAVYATGRVRNYVITQPSADVTVTWTQLPVLRELTLVKGA